MPIRKRKKARTKRKKARTKHEQIAFRFYSRGGYQGRGKYGNRPARQGPAHDKRERFRDKPVHVTMRISRGVRADLRNGKFHDKTRACLRAARDKFRCRFVHYSIQGNHLHLLIEAADNAQLSIAMKGFQIRLAKAVNGCLGRRSGTVFPLRYHAHVLKNPLETRNALLYILNNAKKHAAERGDPMAYKRTWVDPCSSAAYFDGWRPECWRFLPAPEPPETAPVVPVEHWMLTTGWKRHPLLDTAEVPKG